MDEVKSTNISPKKNSGLFSFSDKRLPGLSIILVAITIIIIAFNLKYWNNPYRVITSDVLSYYAYLPATFVYKDLSFSFTDGDFEKYKYKFWLFKTKDDKIAILTTMGLSMMWSPFFLFAHLVAPVLGFEADGYSAPYKFALLLSSLSYLLLGLFFLKRVLQKYFNSYITASTILLIVMGTNLLYYTTLEPTMSHGFSFSLICMFLFITIRWHEKPNIINSLIFGLLLGLISLVRPSNILVLLLFVLWGVSSLKEFWLRTLFFLRSYKLVLIMIFAFIIIWLPQFIYWKYISGSFLFNSYGENDASFFFNNPQIFYTLFSYRKGWLVYTPLAIFALTGIFLTNRYIHKARLSILIYTVVNIYVISSWWCWWYGGGFGQRSFVDQYGVLAMGLASSIKWVFEKKYFYKVLLIVVILALVLLNFFQTKQYYNGAIHYVGMTKKSYWGSFLKLHPSQEFVNEIVWPDYDAAKKGIYYPETEISVGEKYKILHDTLYNRQDSISYYKKKMTSDSSYMRMLKGKAEKRNVSVEEMIEIDAGWLYEQEQKIQKEKNQPLEYFIKKIENDSSLFTLVKKKAREQNIPLEKMILKDAKWLQEQSNKK